MKHENSTSTATLGASAPKAHDRTARNGAAVRGTDIAVVGAGFVGLVAAAGFAEFGHSVTCIEIDRARLDLLQSGHVPFFEQDLEELLSRNLKEGRIRFSADIQSAVRGQRAIFMAVGTPSAQDGRTDLSALEQATDSIADCLDDDQIVVLKSTVPIGTGRHIRERIAERRGTDCIRVLNNPEFLREGTAVYDFFNPQRIVLGCDDGEALESVAHMYRLGMRNAVPFVLTNNETAEMIKYASNAFIALKVGYANELAGLCDRLGVNVLEVARAMGMDPRIGSEYLVPGPGWGGSCLGKDLRELTGLAASLEYENTITKSLQTANAEHHAFVVDKIREQIGTLENTKVGVLGLAFKAGTSDVRESPALAVVRLLIAAGARVHAFDPRANGAAAAEIPQLQLADTPDEVAADADCLVILTEWEQFQTLDFRTLAGRMRRANLVDTRNLLVPETVRRMGFNYLSMGQN